MNVESVSRPLSWGVGAFVVALAATGGMAGDDEPCATCHENTVRAFQSTVHGKLRAFEVDGELGCASCHGNGTAHADAGGDPALIRTLNPDLPFPDVTDVCVECHRAHELQDWQGSTHALNAVGCLDCHNPHATGDRLRGDPEVCWPCHESVAAQFKYPSHHPVQEGHMRCGSCHAVHGTSLEVGLLRTEMDLNQLCFECHPAQEGPWVFEHEPVSESCAVCHEPHGAVANNLLSQTEPFLCLQCHEFHFHAGLEAIPQFSDAGVTNDAHAPLPTGYIPRYDPANSPSDGQTYPGGQVPNPWGASGYKRAFTTKCTQCHTQVHGSDLPSQTVPGQGRALAR
jgi:DmsE family decaheme c-type cytochrome